MLSLSLAFESFVALYANFETAARLPYRVWDQPYAGHHDLD